MRSASQWLSTGRLIRNDAEPTFSDNGKMLFHRRQTFASVSCCKQGRLGNAIIQLFESAGCKFVAGSESHLVFKVRKHQRTKAIELIALYSLSAIGQGSRAIVTIPTNNLTSTEREHEK